MPKHKKKSKNKDTKDSKEDDMTFAPITFITNRPGTMIDMLDSSEPKLLLRVIGTLCQACVENRKNLEYMLTCGLYKSMIPLLKSTDIYILRFTASLINMVVSDSVFLLHLELEDIQKTSLLIKDIYLKIADKLTTSLSSHILTKLVKYHSSISDLIYSIEFVDKILEYLRTEKDLELALENLKLLFYTLGSSQAEGRVLRYNSAFMGSLLCYLEISNNEQIRSYAVDIIHKMAMWKSTEVLHFLGKSKIVEAMMRLLFLGLCQYDKHIFEIIYVMLSEDVCAMDFVKSLEFVQFLEWTINKCPRGLSGSASLILRCLSERESLLQVLYDFSAEVSAISLFRFVSEAIILNVCDLILNMIRHRFCCEQMATSSLMSVLVDIVNEHEVFPMVPYGERALKTLHKFFQCHVKTRKLVYEAKCIPILADIFCKAKPLMHDESYLQIIDIIEYIISSEYWRLIRNIEIFQTTIDLYINATYEEGKLINIMQSLADSNEFREVFLDRKLFQVIMEKLKNHNSEFGTQNLMLIKKLIVYKNIGLAFINEGYLSQLKYLKNNWKFKTYLIDAIIEALYDLCLTVKFFYKNKLWENDKIRDGFILIPDALYTIPLKAFRYKPTLSMHIPIYVVNYENLIQDEKEETIQETDDYEPSSSSFRRCAQTTSQLCPYHHLAVFPSKLVESSINLTQILSSPNAIFLDDRHLTLTIETIYKKFYNYNEGVYLRRSYKVKYIAKTIANLLSGAEALRVHSDKKHAYRYYVRDLIRTLGTNFVPIGIVKYGLQMERALLFKVICDMTKVSTTLCHENDCYYNEIAMISNCRQSDGKFVSQVYIVDLMENIGEMMQEDSKEAKDYLGRHKTTFGHFF